MAGGVGPTQFSVIMGNGFHLVLIRTQCLTECGHWFCVKNTSLTLLNAEKLRKHELVMNKAQIGRSQFQTGEGLDKTGSRLGRDQTEPGSDGGGNGLDQPDENSQTLNTNLVQIGPD